MEDVSDGNAPYEDVRLLDCQDGERGDIFEFPASWEGLLHGYFGISLPEYVRIVEEDAPAKDPKSRKEQLIEIVSKGIAELREISDSSIQIPISKDGDIGVEIMPNSGDDRVGVSCRFMGDTVVNYTDEGLVVDVFSADRELMEPVKRMWFDAAELMFDEQENANRNGDI